MATFKIKIKNKTRKRNSKLEVVILNQLIAS